MSRMSVSGNELLAYALEELNVKDFFYLMGGPMLHAERACLDRGLRGVDVRHEMGAAMAAHAYSRITGTPGVCMAASGPGTTNLITGVATAWADRAPIVVLGGSAGVENYERGGFQEVDQVSMMRPITKWATRVHDTERIPEYVGEAWHRAQSGTPGPVYLDLPTNVLYGSVDSAP